MTERHSDVPAADVVTIGESMVLFQSLQPGKIAYVPLFTSSVAGAEGNVSVGLVRLGLSVRWISKLGTDPFGDLIQRTLTGEGIDLRFVMRDPNHPTAIYFKENASMGDPNVYYYRKGSAASTLSPDDVKPEWFAGAKHLHVTGITPALGEHTAAMIRKAMETARSMGLTVSLDPNVRFKLWDPETARRTLLSLIPLCDLFLPGMEEAEFLTGPGTPEQYATRFADMGVGMIAVKLGPEGSFGYCNGSAHRVPGFPVSAVVDTVGAGDAFAAGFLSEMVGLDMASDQPALRLPAALKRGNMMGAMATQFRGDWEGLPTLQELERLLSGDQEKKR